jgi:hypothetical protein
VQIEGEHLQSREVMLGLRNANSIEVKAGLMPGNIVVTSGGFALKSRMLSELLSE